MFKLYFTDYLHGSICRCNIFNIVVWQERKLETLMFCFRYELIGTTHHDSDHYVATYYNHDGQLMLYDGLSKPPHTRCIDGLPSNLNTQYCLYVLTL